MAEYCSDCAPFDGYDINLFKMALKLKRGYEERILCEGCYIRAIRKDEDGNLFLIRLEEGVTTEEAVTQESLIYTPKD
jgi:hypothetical protein